MPTSHTRMIAGVEALNGLLLIGWSASFTYLAMERYWPLHGGTPKARCEATVSLPEGDAKPARARLFPTDTAP